MVGLAMLGLLWELDNGPDLLSDEPLLWMKKGVKHNQTCEARISEKHRCPDWKGRFSKACTGVISVTHSRQTNLSLVFPLSDTTSWRWLSKFPFTGILGFPGFPTCLYIHLPWQILNSNRDLWFQMVLPNIFPDRSWLLVFDTPPFSLSMTGLLCFPCGCQLILHPFPFNVKYITASFAALSSKTFMWDSRSSTDQRLLQALATCFSAL